MVVAPPKVDPRGAINLTDLANEAMPSDAPGFIVDLLKKYPWFKYLPLILLLIFLLIMLLFFRTLLGGAVFAAVTAALIWLYTKFQKWDKEIKDAEAVSQVSQKPEAVGTYPSSSDFKISTPNSGFTPVYEGTDSAEATNFKAALKDAFTLVNVKFQEPPKTKLNFSDITAKVIEQLNPAFTIPKRINASVKIPQRIKDNMGGNICAGDGIS